MSNVVTRNVATSADEAAKVVPAPNSAVFGLGIIDTVKANMWNGRTVLDRRMPAETYILSRRTERCQRESARRPARHGRR